MQNAGVTATLHGEMLQSSCSELGAPSLRRFVRNRKGETHDTDRAGQSLEGTWQEVQTAAENDPEHLAAACLWMWRKNESGSKDDGHLVQFGNFFCCLSRLQSA